MARTRRREGDSERRHASPREQAAGVACAWQPIALSWLGRGTGIVRLLPCALRLQSVLRDWQPPECTSAAPGRRAEGLRRGSGQGAQVGAGARATCAAPRSQRAQFTQPRGRV